MKVFVLLRMAVVALLLGFGVVTAAPVAAQDETVVAEPEGQVEEAGDEAGEVVGDVDEEVGGVVEDVGGDDDFWDWGLLGLLGLLGLAGLFRQPRPVVHDTERPVTARRTADIDDDTRV